MTLFFFSVIIALIGCETNHSLKEGKIQEYIPSTKIQFEHAVHSSLENVACNYCHNSRSSIDYKKELTESICLDCHELNALELK